MPAAQRKNAVGTSDLKHFASGIAISLLLPQLVLGMRFPLKPSSGWMKNIRSLYGIYVFLFKGTEWKSQSWSWLINIWSNKNLIFQLWSVYCIAKSLCRERHLLPSTGDSVCWNSLPMWSLSCLYLRANYKYFLNMHSHPNNFPNECTNHTFGYALSDHEVIQK